MLAAMNDRKIERPTCEGLGGRSVMSWALHIRGHYHDYDEWAELGNDGWSDMDVTLHFRKSGKLVGDIQDNEQHRETP